MRVAKTKGLISFAVTANREADLRLCFRICKKPFSHDEAHWTKSKISVHKNTICSNPCRSRSYLLVTWSNLSFCCLIRFFKPQFIIIFSC